MHPTSNLPTHSRGFTLIEVIIVVVLIGIILGIAAPNFKIWIVNQKLTAVTNDFFEALSRARNEAINRNKRVTMVACKNDWANGWMVFVDTDNDSAKSPSATDEIIARYPKLPNLITVAPPTAANPMLGFLDTGSAGVFPECEGGTTGTGGARYVTFYGTGMAVKDNGSSVAANNRVIFQQSDDATNARCVILSTGGRIRIVSSKQANGLCP